MHITITPHMRLRVQDANKEIRDAVKKVVDKEASGALLTEARSSVPKDTGTLAGKLRYDPSPKSIGGKLIAPAPGWLLANGTVKMAKKWDLAGVVQDWWHTKALPALEGILP